TASAGGVDFAVGATGRPEAMLAAYLATRARGAAVLVRISRADAVLPLPALTIPRGERRVLGSIYGSSKPERDFPQALALYRSGRLPLDRLVSHRLAADADDEQGNRTGRRTPEDHLGRGPARDRPGRARRRRRRAARGERRPACPRRRLDRPGSGERDCGPERESSGDEKGTRRLR